MTMIASSTTAATATAVTAGTTMVVSKWALIGLVGAGVLTGGVALAIGGAVTAAGVTGDEFADLVPFELPIGEQIALGKIAHPEYANESLV